MNGPRRFGRGWALATLAFVNLLWAAQYPAYKIAGEAMSAAALNFWTLSIAIVLLTPLMLDRRGQAPRTRSLKRAHAAGQFAILGIFGILPPSVLLAWGVAHSTASNAAILSLAIPVLMTLLAAVMLGERLTLLRVGSLVMALAGTLVISWTDVTSGLWAGSLLAGNAAVLLAGLGSAFYNVYGKALLDRFSEIEVLTGGYVVGAVCCAAISAAYDKRPFYMAAGYSGSVWVSICVLGSLTWGLAMVLWMWVLRRLAASQISVSIYLLPVFGVALSALTVGERLGSRQIAGGILVLAGTYLTSEFEHRRRRHDAAGALAGRNHG